MLRGPTEFGNPVSIYRMHTVVQAYTQVNARTRAHIPLFHFPGLN